MSRVAVVTGANQGIGFEIVKQLVDTKLFSTVYLGSRDVARGQVAAAAIGHESVKLLNIDLQSDAAIAAAVEQLRREQPLGVDVLINNAGFAFKTDASEPFGHQAAVTTEINYFGTKKVIFAMQPALKDGARIVNVASRAGNLGGFKLPMASAFRSDDLTLEALDSHIRTFIEAAEKGIHKSVGFPNSAYGTSKAAEIAMTRIMSRSDPFTTRGITINACCPGWCRTGMSSFSGEKSASEGADTPVWLAVSDDVQGRTGGFFGERLELTW